jgi:hypothetical protein
VSVDEKKPLLNTMDVIGSLTPTADASMRVTKGQVSAASLDAARLVFQMFAFVAVTIKNCAFV